MHLNTLSPADGSRQTKLRVGRGVGCGKGKTCGRGHKGALARSGSGRRQGFEGGQMPLQRRLPKYGFSSRKGAFYQEIRLSTLNKLEEADVDMALLKKSQLVPVQTKTVKIILSGEITRAINVKGLRVTAGAKKAIEAKGGSVTVEASEA